MAESLHRCEANGCERLVPSHLLMCAAHWRLVPNDIQRDVYRTHRAIGGDIPHQRLNAVKAYRQAVSAAVSALDGIASQQGKGQHEHPSA